MNHRLGISLMILTSFVFAFQDGISKHLAVEYNSMMVVMIRYWFFGSFVIALSATRQGGIRVVARTNQPLLQICRGVLLAAEIFIMITAIALIGLAESLALFACNPLIVAALSGPILGERVGWRRWMAILAGLAGVLLILQPGFRVFSPHSLLAVASAVMFAVYVLLTRYAARRDSAETSFFWAGFAGAVGATFAGIWFWQPMAAPDWIWMGILCVSGATGHYILIKVYEISEAGVVQPFAYFHMVFGSMIGIVIFGESLKANVVAGGLVIVLAGLFVWWREQASHGGEISRFPDRR
ncbi:MAG: DMT family transporter [Rhodobacteraceae bacterium]|nr:DMT family transporter [Paracoccaceae bacterium]